ncbi:MULTISPECIES: hypothetical protein [unclassified Wenzhouxiangella]|uniref:hypothetical protein n=1 Tax=unclassified Wenzhouxiangella TaxID=2613841 RepID=UPI0011C16DBF|nr:MULTISPECIES: hypothetical protein [unclassified Wenzhouxiangella]
MPKHGSEQLVNTTTPDDQWYPDVAGLQNGGYVAVWEDDSMTGGDSSGTAIRARALDIDGNTLIPEFLVNTTTQGDQDSPSVAALNDGGFVITWPDSSSPDGDASIRLRVYDADGTPRTGELLIDVAGANLRNPDVASLANGGFVVVWGDTRDFDDTGIDVRFQRFSAEGDKRGGEILANSSLVGDQRWPAVSSLSDGGFVVVWETYIQTTVSYDDQAARGQVFNSDGTMRGPEFFANATTEHIQDDVDVAGLNNGEFIVIWTHDEEPSDIHGQRFDAMGSKLGSELVINAGVVTGSQQDASVAPFGDGGFIATWEDYSQDSLDADSSAVFAQAYDANNINDGGVFLVNDTVIGPQAEPSVASIVEGGFAIAWQDDSQSGGDTSGRAIRSQVFTDYIFSDRFEE